MIASQRGGRTRNTSAGRHVLVLSGYGLHIGVERGHLVTEDGVGRDRRRLRFSRIDRYLHRLVVLGHTGSISFDAIRWLSDVGVPFLQIDTDGRVLAQAGPSGPDHPVLRRAQARAVDSSVGLELVRELLCQKLEGQQEVLRAFTAGQLAIPGLELAKRSLRTAPDFIALRIAESRAASAYWAAWQNVPVQFARKRLARVPVHWRTFGSRTSGLTSSPRLAVNPPNAILNYLYAILEAESRTALLAVGCDPGVGIQHADQRSRDSMACDVMEAVRPRVDAYTLDLLASRIFRWDDFVETREGGCRVAPSLAKELSRTWERWATHLGPVVEEVAKRLYESAVMPSRKPRWTGSQRAVRRPLPTPLTESNRSEGRRTVRAQSVSRLWSATKSKPNEVPREGATPVRASKARVGDVGRSQPALSGVHLLRALLSGAEPLTRTHFLQAVVPALRNFSAQMLADEVGLSIRYCARIRAGGCTPGRSHWENFRQFLSNHSSEVWTGGI